MLSQLAHLSVEADGRYATAEELQFLKDYLQSFNQRLSTYQKIQACEQQIIQQIELEIQKIDLNLLRRGSQDATSKWRLDTIRVLRHSTAALLMGDPERLHERFLLWFRTIVGAFQVRKCTAVTYQVMQTVLKHYLSVEELSLIMPILEENRTILGG